MAPPKKSKAAKRKNAERTQLSELETQVLHQLREAGGEPILDVLNFHVEVYELETDLWRLTTAVQRLLRLGFVQFCRGAPEYRRVTNLEERELRDLSSYITWGKASHGEAQWIWGTTEAATKWDSRETYLALTDAGYAIYGQNRDSP